MIDILNNFNSDTLAKSMIRLFASNSIKDIEENASLIRGLFLGSGDVDTSGSFAEVNERILEKSGYSNFYCRVREQKKSIETILSAGSDLPQVRGILQKLSYLRKAPSTDQYKAQIFKSLIDAAIANASLWSTNSTALEKYKHGSSMIAEWVDFFLSYTNRNQPEVNNTFEPILKNKFSEKEWQSSVEEMNLVAKLLVRYIKERTTLNVIFYDKQAMVCGDKIKDKVYRYCENTFAFAQLIQWQIITDNGAWNWCLDEYRRFREFNGNNEKGEYYFRTYDVSANPNEAVDAAPEDEEWRSWLRSAISTHNIVIGKDMDADVLRDECRKIGAMIKNNRESIINRYLETIN